MVPSPHENSIAAETEELNTSTQIAFKTSLEEKKQIAWCYTQNECIYIRKRKTMLLICCGCTERMPKSKNGTG